MPPKGKKGGAVKDKKFEDEQREEPLQAVLFADSFETRFNPFTLEQPRCLLPLANTPLIEYTLEFLARAGVEEVFLCCGNHTDTLEEYLSNSKWMSNAAPFSLEIIRSTSKSVGDCMRVMHEKDLIVGDFLCVYGDVVANVALESALAAHRARREKDKKAIMTMVFREAGDTHRTKSQSPRLVYVIDPSTGRCVHYEQLRPGQPAKLDIPGELLKDHVDLEVREDLIDCGIDICTPEVLAQYTDNFDWQLPRAGFLRGVLKDFETFQLTIHTHIATEGYAARVKNLRAYDAITKDLVSRWTYPLTPDSNLISDQSFQLYKGNVYREDGVVLARSCNVGRRVVLGKATSVGDQSIISNSIIGRRCVIGKRVKIDGAYIWDDVHIGDDTVVEKAMIANGTAVGKNCRIETGALISYGVKVSDGATVSGDRRLTTLKRKRGHDKDDVVEAKSDPKIVGEDGIGFHLDLDEDEEEVADTILAGMQTLDIAVDDISTLDSDEEDSEDDVRLHHARTSSMRSDSFASIDSDETGDARSRATDFHKEAVQSLFEDITKGNDPGTIQTELKALILTANAEDKQIRRAIAVAFTKRISGLVEQGRSFKDAVKEVIPKYKALVEGFLREHEWQGEFMFFVQTDLTHRKQGGKILFFLSHALAANDLVEAEGFEVWWNDARSSASESLEAVRKDTKPLVDTLLEESEDEDDDDDDEEEEEESEDE